VIDNRKRIMSRLGPDFGDPRGLEDASLQVLTAFLITCLPGPG
jgi:hypothetical protein